MTRERLSPKQRSFLLRLWTAQDAWTPAGRSTSPTAVSLVKRRLAVRRENEPYYQITSLGRVLAAQIA